MSGSVRFVLRFGFGFADSQDQDQEQAQAQDTVGIGIWPVTGQSLGSAKPPPWESSLQLKRGYCAFCIIRASVSLTRLGVTCIGEESSMLVMRFPTRAHPGSSVGGHSHSYSNRHLSGTRLHRDQNRCADTSIYTGIQYKRSESPTVTARIHSLSGIAPIQRIIEV